MEVRMGKGCRLLHLEEDVQLTSASCHKMLLPLGRLDRLRIFPSSHVSFPEMCHSAGAVAPALR